MVVEESNPDVGAERKPLGVSERLVSKRDVVSEIFVYTPVVSCV